MKNIILIIVFFVISFQEKYLTISKIQNSEWLIYEIGQCQEKYTFADSTFTLNHCEIPVNYEGKFKMQKDTLYLLYPKLKKDTFISTINGDTFIVNPPQRQNHLRPILEKFQYKNDTLYFIEKIHMYKTENQTIANIFNVNIVTRIN